MHLMDGEIFADIIDGNVMSVTLELRNATADAKQSGSITECDVGEKVMGLPERSEEGD